MFKYMDTHIDSLFSAINLHAKSLHRKIIHFGAMNGFTILKPQYFLNL